MKIKLRNIETTFLTFIWLMPSAFHFSTTIQVFLRLIAFIFILCTCKIKKIKLIKLFIIYMVVTLISVFLEHGSIEAVGTTMAMTSIPLGIVIYFCDDKNKNNVIDGLFKALTIVVFIDILTAIFAPQGLNQNMFGQPIYFSGGKFTVCYIFIVWMILYFLRKSRKVSHMLAIIGFGVVYAYRVDCNTGLIGILVFGVIILLPKFMTTKKTQYFWLGGLVGVNYLIVIMQIQTMIPIINMFITEALNREANLTGRMSIYNNISIIMNEHWIWGYGYTSSHIMDITGLGNTQNGFLQLIYIGGIIGIIVFMSILINLFKSISNIYDERVRRILLASLTAFFIIAIVEIPFNKTMFFMVVGIVELYSKRFECRKISSIS